MRAQIMNARNNRKNNRRMTRITADMTAICQYKRGFMTTSEVDFTVDWLEPYLMELSSNGVLYSDSKGNMYLTVGLAPTTAFTAHTDSVHRTMGTQTVVVDEFNWMTTTDGECLGADDAAGIVILIEMIKRRIPGVYCFFVGEECGGVGSSHAASVLAKGEGPLVGVDMMISYDRKGTDDVITHQGWGECCSVEFAKALGKAYNMKPCSGGVYTDSAEFTDLIAECTNISVGYYNEHTAMESCSLDHLCALVELACSTNYNDLPVVRDPSNDPLDHFPMLKSEAQQAIAAFLETSGLNDDDLEDYLWGTYGVME